VTERKPAGMGVETWIDVQIRQATERGDFANLPGLGKPLANEGQQHDEMWWLKEKMAREGLTLAPPSLVLRKEIETALEAAEKAASETRARRLLTEINEKIAAAMRRPPAGPSIELKMIDVEEFVRDWRTRRTA
jgi:Domain of unknown function (DUF1992)